MGSLRLRSFSLSPDVQDRRIRCTCGEIFPTTLPRFCVGVAQVHPRWLRARASAVIQRRSLQSFTPSPFRGISSSCADDHVDRSFLVRPMTWRFLITPCITLSTYANSSFRRGEISDGKQIFVNQKVVALENSLFPITFSSINQFHRAISFQARIL